MAITVEGLRSPAPARELSVSDNAPTERKPSVASPEERPFAKVLHGLSSNLERGERTMERVRGQGGAELGASELLALQAEVYRYSEAVDLSAKLVDRATNGVKTVLQGQ
jgi:hypothetical protein